MINFVKEVEDIIEVFDHSYPDGLDGYADTLYQVKLVLDMVGEAYNKIKDFYENGRMELCNRMLRNDTIKLDKGNYTATIQTKSRWSPIVQYKGDVLDYFKNNKKYEKLWTITSIDLNKTLTELAENGLPPELEGKCKEYVEQHVRLTEKKTK